VHSYTEKFWLIFSTSRLAAHASNHSSSQIRSAKVSCANDRAWNINVGISFTDIELFVADRWKRILGIVIGSRRNQFSGWVKLVCTLQPKTYPWFRDVFENFGGPIPWLPPFGFGPGPSLRHAPCYSSAPTFRSVSRTWSRSVPKRQGSRHIDILLRETSATLSTHLATVLFRSKVCHVFPVCFWKYSSNWVLTVTAQRPSFLHEIELFWLEQLLRHCSSAWPETRNGLAIRRFASAKDTQHCRGLSVTRVIF